MTYDSLILKKIAELQTALSLIRPRGEEYAECEKNYRMALAEELQKPRENIKAAALLSEIVKGLPNIAELRSKRDKAKSSYNSATFAVETYQTILKSYITITGKDEPETII